MDVGISTRVAMVTFKSFSEMFQSLLKFHHFNHILEQCDDAL